MDVQLTVTLKADGSVNVSGPLENPIMCYGLLDAAKDAIRENAARLATSRKIVPIFTPIAASPPLNGS